jgi:hypothetical protein
VGGGGVVFCSQKAVVWYQVVTVSSLI